MTVQTVFDRMMLYDNQLDLVASGDDVTRGLTAINMVTDWMEAEATAIEGVLTTNETLSTTADQEHTTWPARLLRLDEDPWYVDTTQSPNLPVWQIGRIQGAGNHIPGFSWPYSELVLSGSATLTTGKPREYSAEGPGGRFFWAPRPDAIYTIRAYGLWAVADYTAVSGAGGVLLHPDALANTLAAMAAKVFRIGLDRDTAVLEEHVREVFRPALKGLSRFSRTQPQSKVYTEYHDA